MAKPEKINIAHKFSLFRDTWSPKLVGKVNDFDVKVVKLEGEFEWHHHQHEDELFLIVKGQLVIHFRDGAVELNAGELLMDKPIRL